MSSPPEIHPQVIATAKEKFSNEKPTTDDLKLGTFFDDPEYLDSLPRDAKLLVCAIQAAGPDPMRPGLCHSQSEKFLNDYLKTKDADLLKSAMAAEAMALRWVPLEVPERARYNQHMSLLYQMNHEVTKNAHDLDEAIRHSELAVQLWKGGNEELSSWVNVLASIIINRYSLTHQRKDFDGAKKYLRNALEVTSLAPTEMLSFLHQIDLALEASKVSDSSEAVPQPAYMALLVEATTILESKLAANQTPPYLESRVYRTLGKGYILRASTADDLDLIQSAILYLAKAIVTSASIPLFRNLIEEDYTEACRQRDTMLSNSKDSTNATGALKRIIERNSSLLNFQVQLADLYRHEGHNTIDVHLAEKRLNEAVRLMEEAISIMPVDLENRGDIYDRCSAAHYSRYEALRSEADIRRAIDCSRLALETPTKDNSWSFARLLGQCLLDLHEKTSQSQDLIDALKAILEATKLAGGASNTEGLSECKWMVGKILRRQYDGQPVEQTLLQAIENFSGATTLMPQLSLSRTLALNDLGNAYTKLFTHNAKPEYLDKSIDAFRQSLEIMEKIHPSTQHPDILMVNSSLAGAMLQRFRYWHLEQDLHSSISYYRNALKGIGPSNSRYAPRAGNLCQALRELYALQGDKGDTKLLTEAKKTVSKALENAEILDVGMRSWLEHQLGDVFYCSFVQSKLSSQKDSAIKHYDEALALPNVTTTQRAHTMINKALVLKVNAEQTGLQDDFQASYDVFEKVGQLLPKTDPTFWQNCINQANLTFEMHKRGLGPSKEFYGLIAMEKYQFIAGNTMAPPQHRISSSSVAAALAYDVKHDAKAARDAICICLELLPQAILLHENRLEQLKMLRTYHYVPSGAAALSIAAEDPVSLAIQRLEAGRANIWDRLLSQRTTEQHLKTIDEELAKRFQGLQVKLSQQSAVSGKDIGTPRLTAVAPKDEERLQRQRDAREYQDLSQKIRQAGVGPEFLDPFNDTSHLQYLADDAPVVFINASGYRSDAIIVVKEKQPFSIGLPDFNMAAIQSMAAVLLVAQDKYSSGIEETILEGFADYKSVMKWLWEAAAKPVLEAIDFSIYPIGPSGKPCIIWVVTGWMTVFPIHAAGDFTSPNATVASVHDMVVSTYTPSLKALAFAKQRRSQISVLSDQMPFGAAIVAMESTPGMENGDLNVEPEVKSFTEELKDYATVDVLLQKDSRTVKEHLQKSKIVHFACHGLLDPQDPSKSALLLQDCATKGELKKSQPFCVWIILKMQLQDCGLVYLSTCDSGANRDLLLRDEGLHVAGAFHMAGVPNVISTLWKVRDSVSTDLSRLFYANLIDERGELDIFRSADALHMAVQVLRDRGEEPMLWGPFVHSGP